MFYKSNYARVKLSLTAAILGLLAACSEHSGGAMFNDPFEDVNRQAHEINKKLDKAVIKPVAQTYTDLTPEPFEKGVSNFAANISQPSHIANYLLQGNLAEAMNNFGGFMVNTIFGLGGLFDVAGNAGHFTRDTNFGETLAVWGVQEGAYIELVGLGPTTERGAVGKIVDVVMNPVSPLLNAAQSQTVTAAKIGELLTDRIDYGETVDSLLYDSADSYAQARMYYLQNLRFKLGIKPEETIDPFEELYGTE